MFQRLSSLGRGRGSCYLVAELVVGTAPLLEVGGEELEGGGMAALNLNLPDIMNVDYEVVRGPLKEVIGARKGIDVGKVFHTGARSAGGGSGSGDRPSREALGGRSDLDSSPIVSRTAGGIEDGDCADGFIVLDGGEQVSLEDGGVGEGICHTAVGQGDDEGPALLIPGG